MAVLRLVKSVPYLLVYKTRLVSYMHMCFKYYTAVNFLVESDRMKTSVKITLFLHEILWGGVD